MTGSYRHTKLDRTCPRCRAHRYHQAVRDLIGYANKILDGFWQVTVTCAECAHRWRGRFRRDEWT